MRLRRQLLLVSLLGLSLPWAGCQYIREMEDALRQGQSIALLATAQAVANRISNEPALLQELQQPAAQVYAENQIYAHPFAAPAIIDGYDDEWRHREFDGLRWAAPSFRVQLQAARHDRDLYLFIHVEDPQILYYNPGFESPAQSDHLLLRMYNKDGEVQDFLLTASAPGLITVHAAVPDYNEFSERITRYVREHRIKGAWQERSAGYQVEVQLPLALTHGYLSLAVINQIPDSDGSNTDVWLGAISSADAPKPLVTQNAVLAEALNVFADEDLRLRITGRNQWLIAEAGQLQSPSRLPVEENGLLAWLMRHLFTHHDLPPLDTPQFSGRLDAEEIQQALNGDDARTWYRYGVHNLGRAVVPIVRQTRIIGTVVVEQTSASILSLTNNAFQRLMFYTLLATFFAGAGLVAYASWLSLRIRRLSEAADSAMREDGKLENQFPVSRAQDEIGDLNRSYAQLLTRLQEYTDYLRTLSNKLSHELRTPLAVVRSSLDNLDNETLDEQARVYATRAQEGSQRLSAILNAISSAGRVEESIRTTEREAVPLEQILRELTLAYQDIAPQKIVCDINPADKEYVIQGSADLIVQMIDKLFDNACDFCPVDGTITFALRKRKDQILLTVSNDGPLLPQKMQSQLFDSLVSLRDSKEKVSDKIHLGLGLHIVRLIAEVHHARVSARNRTDQTGVEFEIIFPAPL